VEPSLLLELRLSSPVNLLVLGCRGEGELLYGCETWSLTLREEHRLRIFEN
jgi:hypothetical protein